MSVADAASEDDNTVEHSCILLAVDASRIAAVTQSVNNLALVLNTSIEQAPAETYNAVSAAHQASFQYDTTLCDSAERPQDWLLNDEDALSDLWDFANKLSIQPGLSPTATQKATAIMSQIDAAVITTTHMSGEPWFVTDTKRTLWTIPTETRGIGIYSDFHGYSLASNSGTPVTVLG